MQKQQLFLEAGGAVGNAGPSTSAAARGLHLGAAVAGAGYVADEGEDEEAQAASEGRSRAAMAPRREVVSAGEAANLLDALME